MTKDYAIASLKNNTDYLIQENLERLSGRMRTQLNLAPYEDVHDPVVFCLSKNNSQITPSDKCRSILEAGLRFLPFVEASRLVTLSKLTTDEAVRGLKKKALIEATSVPRSVRVMIWKSFFSPSALTLKFKDHTGVSLDEDDNIINLDVKRTYSNNPAFDKPVVLDLT